MGTLLDAIATQTTIVYPISGAMLSARSMVEGLKHIKVDCACIVPPFVEEIARVSDLLDFVSKNLPLLLYSSGGINERYGNAVMEKLKLFNLYGTTEVGVIPTICVQGAWPIEDWKYFCVHPIAGAEFRYRSSDLYEMVVVRNSKLEEVQPVFKLFPEVQEYTTKDLFSPHPLKPGLWAHRGRTADIITLITGLTANPDVMEQHVGCYPEVRVALMVGTQQSQTALLIESSITPPPSISEERNALTERLWPMIDEANQIYPRDTRVTKSHVILVDPERPIPKTAKGSVQRNATLVLYAKELEEVYARDEPRVSYPSYTSVEQQHSTISETPRKMYCKMDRFIEGMNLQ